MQSYVQPTFQDTADKRDWRGRGLGRHSFSVGWLTCSWEFKKTTSDWGLVESQYCKPVLFISLSFGTILVLHIFLQVHFFVSVSSGDPNAATISLLKRMISDELGKKLNWCGPHGKKGFMNLQLCTVLHDNCIRKKVKQYEIIPLKKLFIQTARPRSSTWTSRLWRWWG